jgi:1,4-dihydroxy-6-naphthoate synthase
MTTDLAGKFIGMYVNDYTRDYGDTGRMAIREFLNAGVSRGYITRPVELEFVS